MSKPRQVEELEQALGFPLINIDEYGGLDDYEYDWREDEDEPIDELERLLAPQYRKCYRLSPEGTVLALNLTDCPNPDASAISFLTDIYSLSVSFSYTDEFDTSLFARLENLRHLSLSLRYIGEFDDSSIAGLTKLRSLSLSISHAGEFSGSERVRET